MGENKLRYLIWVFIILTISEGILRKWLLPSLSTPLMASKDLFSAIIVILGYKYGFVRSKWADMSVILGCLTFWTTMTLGHQNILVAIWGCKILWFGIPLCYVIKNVFKPKDIAKIMTGTLVLTITNAIVMLFQFTSPAGTWINKLPAGETVKENLLSLSAAESSGAIRPSGIFAHTTQISLFCPFALGLILFYLFRNKELPDLYKVPRWLIPASLIAFVIVAICSVSRTIIFSSIAITLFILFFLFKNRQSYIFRLLLIAPVLCFVLYQIPLINKGVENMANRFESASSSTNSSAAGDFYRRIVEYNVNALIDPRDFKGNPPPFFGHGQGLSTQVGGRLAGVGKNSSGFSLAEWDALRIMLESGLIFGWLIIFNRLGCVLSNFTMVLRQYRKQKILPLCLYGSFLVGFYFYTQWGNSFQLAFSCLSAGIFMAVCKNNIIENEHS